MPRISAVRQFSELIASTSFDEMRAQWRAATERQVQAATVAQRRTPHDDLGVLRAHEFLVLMHNFAATRAPEGELQEMDWAVAALDLFGQMDLRGDGLLTWEDFVTFIMALDLSSCGGDSERIDGLEDDTGSIEPKGAVPRVRQYQFVADGLVNEDFPTGVRKLEYLPAPIHRTLAIPCGINGSELVHIITPELPPRISATLRHHSAYRAHNVLNATGVPNTKVVVTTSSVGKDAHYLTLWSLPAGCMLQAEPRESEKNSRPQGTLLPVLVHRIEAQSPQSIVFVSSEARLYSGGEQSGLVYEWELCRKEREGEPIALSRLRACRLHTFGITSIIELERNDETTNLIVTGSADGYISVWNPEDWSPHEACAADDRSPSPPSHQTLTKTTMTLSASSCSLVSGSRKELDPLIQLSAQATGPGTLVLSHDHDLLFAAGRPNAKETVATVSPVLVWKVLDSAVAFRKQIHKSLNRHQSHVADMAEVATESHLVTADITGLVVVWNLPSLDVHQELMTCAMQPICCSQIPAVAATRGSRKSKSAGVLQNGETLEAENVPATSKLVVSTRRIQVYPCQLSVIKEPLILAHYDAHVNVFVVVSTLRVCVWNAKNGRLKSQIEACVLLGGDDAQLPKSTDNSVIRNQTYSETLEDRDMAPPEIVCACVSATGRKMVVGDDRGGLHVCALPPGGHKPYRTKQLDPHEGFSTALAFLDSCGAVLSAGSDGVIGVHDEADPAGFKAGDSNSRDRQAIRSSARCAHVYFGATPNL